MLLLVLLLFLSVGWHMGKAERLYTYISLCLLALLRERGVDTHYIQMHSC